MTNLSRSIPAVLVEDIAFSYHLGREVLRIPAFQIERGEHVFLFGPSGSGKSTLLGLIAGVLRVTQGTLRVLDRDLTTLSNHERDSLRGCGVSNAGHDRGALKERVTTITALEPPERSGRD
jgi:putative ABC transport system ATP-binding protein